MENWPNSGIALTGLGVTSAIGQGMAAYSEALFSGAQVFNRLQRDGRNLEDTNFIGAEISSLNGMDENRSAKLRTVSWSGQVAFMTSLEAWRSAELDSVDPSRIGLVVAGSNFQQRDLFNLQEKYRARPHFIKPNYALNFMDTDLCGVLTEQFNIRGISYTLGGASASGQLGIIQGMQNILSGLVDICIVVGALMDLSHWELRALQSIGAMGSSRFQKQPEYACRPFDCNHDGFIYGEGCGVLVLESINSAKRRGVNIAGMINGFGVAVDGNRNPNPSMEGEVTAIIKAMNLANLTAKDIQYVNPHGTGSPQGDETELDALDHCGLKEAYINATKSITGHCLSAAGTIEVITSIVQMQAGQLHRTLNLESPINDEFNWVKDHCIQQKVDQALSLSMGFGGTNTALCITSSIE